MEESAELRELTLAAYRAMREGDVGFFERHLDAGPGVVALGTDPAEWWVGAAALLSALRAQFAEVGGGFPIEAGDLLAYRDGAAGWVADRATIAFPGGPTVPMRLTIGYRRAADGWRIVQWHASVGAANEEVLGKELTV